GSQYQQVVRQILEYVPIDTFDKDNAGAEAKLREFEEQLRDIREAEVGGIIRYAIFQRSVFETWASLIAPASKYNLSPLDVGEMVKRLLNIALANDCNFSHFQHEYM